jgi:hypothetical protein
MTRSGIVRRRSGSSQLRSGRRRSNARAEPASAQSSQRNLEAQRTTGIAMAIAAGNFAGTPAVTVTVFLTLSGLIMQFVLRKI